MVGSTEERDNLSIWKPWRGDIRLFERVFKVQKFRAIYLARMKEFDQSLFKPERFAQQVDELGTVLRPAVAEESSDKVERFDTVVSGKSLQGAGFGMRFGGGQGGRGFGGPPGFGGESKPIKGFVKVRSQSVHDQLIGKSEGQTIGAGFGFGPGGRGGRGPGGPGGPGGGGPGGFGPGNFLSGMMLEQLDADHDKKVTHDEFIGGFKKWFESWDKQKAGFLTEDDLRAGLNQDLSPFRGGPPPGFGPGGPPETQNDDDN
jgi:hypothetical protein